MSDRWDVHEHRDELKVSDHGTVYHPERGVLCQREQQWDVCLFHPIRFKDRPAAYKWIKSGTIAEIQESLSNLAVMFSEQCMIDRCKEF